MAAGDQAGITPSARCHTLRFNAVTLSLVRGYQMWEALLAPSAWLYVPITSLVGRDEEGSWSGVRKRFPHCQLLLPQQWIKGRDVLLLITTKIQKPWVDRTAWHDLLLIWCDRIIQGSMLDAQRQICLDFWRIEIIVKKEVEQCQCGSEKCSVKCLHEESRSSWEVERRVGVDE